MSKARPLGSTRIRLTALKVASLVAAMAIAFGVLPGTARCQTPPPAESVSPTFGAGASQTFTFTYSSPAGYGSLNQVHALLNAGLYGSGGCWVYYVAGTNSLYLYDNTATTSLGPLTPASAGTLNNSFCTLNGTGSTVTVAGNTLTMTLALNFSASFTGFKTYYGLAAYNGNNNSYWQPLGSWYPGPAPTADSVSPNSGAGATQTFTFKYSSPTGSAGDLNEVDALLNAGLYGSGGCWVYHNVSASALYLYDNMAQTLLGPLGSGKAGTLSNSFCTLNGAGSTVAVSGNTLTMTLALNFSASFTGLKTYYGLAFDDNLNSGWQSLGTWTPNTGPAPAPPTADSVSPNTGAGASQTFTFQYSSPAGYGYLSQVHALLNAGLYGAGACWVYYTAGNNSLYLYDNTAMTSLGPLTPGSAGTVSNSFCTLNGTGSTVTGAGNTLTMTLSLNFSASFTGPKTYYALAFDNGDLNSAWQNLGTWTPN